MIGIDRPCSLRKDDLEEQARVKERLIKTQLARDSAIEAQEAASRLKSIQAEHQTLGQQILGIQFVIGLTNLIYVAPEYL